MPAVPDDDLPVWTIRPNWREGVRERLEWLTDIIEASDGNEQARALRLSPRREFECAFNPWDEDRSYFELWLHRLSADEFMVPLWHDAARLSAAIDIGETEIPFDNTYREFVTDGLALILGDDAQTWEKVTITAQTDAGITISAPGAISAWEQGARIYPLRRARLSDESQLQALSTRVGSASLVFQLNQANDIPDEGEWEGLVFETLPVITRPPNRTETLSTDFMRMVFTLDNDHGLRHMQDDAGRAFTIQAHTWQLVGRAAHWEFRQMLYRLRGRSQAVWLPTFNQDMRLARDALSANSHVHIKKIGYAYTGGAVAGRDRILIDETTPAVISGLGAPLAANEERLNLSGALGANFSAGVSASFLGACRLNQDSVEILHYTDTDGASDCKASFRQFTNTRVEPEVLEYPIPESDMNDTPCGQSYLAYDHKFVFTDLPYMTDSDELNGLGGFDPGTQHGNIQVQFRTNPGFDFYRWEISSVERSANPALNDGTDDWFTHSSGKFEYYLDRETLTLYIRNLGGYTIDNDELAVSICGNEDTGGSTCTCTHYINGVVDPWAGTVGPSTHSGSGIHGSIIGDWDSVLWFFAN